MADPEVGSFTELPYTAARILLSDDVRIGMSMRRIPVLVEVDVTAARSAIAKRKLATGEELSFTGWMIACLARAASESPRVHAVRRGKHRLVLFEDVDVLTFVRREPSGAKPSPDVPMPCVIRAANRKTVEAIHAEIRSAQGRGPPRGGRAPTALMRSPAALRVFASLPFFLRKALFWDRVRKDPFRMKRMMGTVSITSVGMFGKIGGGSNWGLPVDFHPLSVALGAISRKPAVVGDHVEPREFLGVTLMFNHEVIDGAPMAMFAQRLRDLVEGAYGLEASGSPRLAA